MIEEEIWKDVVKFEGFYTVSNMGRIKSLTRIITKKDGKTQPVKERILSTKGGHRCIELKRPGIKSKQVLVYHIVLEAFVGPRPSGMVCRHFPDRNPENNRLDNIQWGTPKQNQEDRIAHGTDHRGEKTPVSKLTESEVRQIRFLYKNSAQIQGVSRRRKLAAFYQVSEACIGKIIYQKGNWTWCLDE